KAAQCARYLVTVEGTKVGVANGKVAIASFLRRKNQAVTGAVHGLEAVFIDFASLGDIGARGRCARNGKHIVGVVLEMARLGPERFLVDRRSDDFLEAIVDVLLAKVVDQTVEDAGAIG